MKSLPYKQKSWTISILLRSSCLIALWPVLGFFSIGLRALASDGYLPIFYLLVWLNGFLFKPKNAFWNSFLGHLLFDFVFYFSPTFIFIWLTSALCSFLIAIFKEQKYFQFPFILLMPAIYLSAFVLIALIYDQKDIFKYFKSFPRITLMLIIVNPIFNFIVYFGFIQKKKTQNLIRLIQNNF